MTLLFVKVSGSCVILVAEITIPLATERANCDDMIKGRRRGCRNVGVEHKVLRYILKVKTPKRQISL